MYSINFTITCLYKMPVRKPAPSDRRVKYQHINVDHYKPFDTLYIMDKFPNAAQQLKDRLAKSVSMRRQLLLYREAHHDSLKVTYFEALSEQQGASGMNFDAMPPNNTQSQAGLSLPASGQIKPSTKATTWKATDFKVVPDDLAVLEEQSIVETATVASTWTGREKIRVPLRPKGEDGEELEEFECPYCWIACIAKSHDIWK